MHFEAKTKAWYDENDELNGISVEWAEPREGLSFFLCAVSGLFSLTGIALVVMVPRNNPEIALSILCIWGVVLYGLYRLTLWIGSARRGMYVCIDGRVDLPKPWDGSLPQGAIMTIASERSEYVQDPKALAAHVVRIYTTNGDVYEITRCMLSEYARKVAVLLNNALNEVREHVAAGARGQHARSSARTRDAQPQIIEVTID